MKKALLPAVLITLSLVVAACGDNDEVTNPPQNETTDTTEQGTETNQDETTNDATTDDNATDGSTSTDDTTEGTTDNSTDLNSNYNFTSFNLEADVENDKDAVDVDFDVETEGTEASYENKQQGIKLAGDEAMDELDSIFTAFRFDEETPDEEVLSEVLEAFNIPEGATNVELEIDFASGTEKEYNQ